MAIRGRDDSRPSGGHGGSRLRVGPIGALTWPQTYVLKAICDVALRVGDYRLTVGQVEDQLLMLGISRAEILTALDPIIAAGYIALDDGPEICDAVIQVMRPGLEAYAYTFVRDYGVIRHKVWGLAAGNDGRDAYELASLAGQPELLVEHILDIAQDAGLLRLARRGYHTVVAEVRPQLRRLVAGIA